MSKAQTSAPLLVGDLVENPWNAQVMQQAAAMFGWQCAFRDRGAMVEGWRERELGPEPQLIELDAIRSQSDPLLAFDNQDGASTLYGYRPPGGTALTLVVGNERRGIANDTLRAADHLVQVPMVSKKVNCLNVAAASAVGLYYLSRGGGGQLFTRKNPHQSRPELLLLGAADHVELGSTIRSAAAFGWRRAFVEDREEVWFGVDRAARSEGRAAARRGKNAISLISTTAKRQFGFEEAVVVNSCGRGRELSKTNLARGPKQLVVLADEAAQQLDDEDFSRLAPQVKFAHLKLNSSDYNYHYRLNATIALAEVARQVGGRAPKSGRGKRPPLYDLALRALAESGEPIGWDELMTY